MHLNNIGQGLCMFDADDRLQLWNESYLRMYRIPPGRIFEGCTVEQMFEAREAVGTIFKDLDQHTAQLRSEIETRVPTSRINELIDGRIIKVTYRPMENGGWVATHDDITERKQNEARIAYLAMHDPVTALPNRAALNQRLGKVIKDASAGKRSFAIVRIDLDHFKDINDAYGQSTGDIVLSRLAKKFQAAYDGDFLARAGGDEFTGISVLEPEAGAVDKLCTRLSALLDNEFEINGVAVHARCSAGISIYPQDGLDAETLIAYGDTALYRAKSEGRGTIQFFESTMDQHVREKRALHRDLGAALEKNEFELYFQPQAMSDGKVAGFEALLRWHHPQR
jgi:diguanylate cyclase (GGDEF)-like protein